jgi:hypothetical protein
VQIVPAGRSRYRNAMNCRLKLRRVVLVSVVEMRELMSKVNGEKARVAIARRRRTKESKHARGALKPWLCCRIRPRKSSGSPSRNPPANSSQKLSRPGAGPPAEPARQHTRITASRRLQFASRCMQLLGGNRRAASASGRGPWPCSLGSSRWADARSIR